MPVGTTALCSLNDPIIQGVISIGHVFLPLRLNNNIIIDNGVIIAFFLLLVNANCTLLCKKHTLIMLFGEYPQKSVVDAAVEFSPQAIEVGHIFRIDADHQCPLPYGRGTPRRGMP